MKPVLVGIEVRHRGARQVLEQIIEAIPGYTVLTRAALPCDLLVMEITGENLDEEFDRVRSILAEGQAKTVFLASTLMDPSVLMQALRVGAKEFIYLPVKGEETRKAFADFIAAAGSEAAIKSKSSPEKQGMIINVLGSKGGGNNHAGGEPRSTVGGHNVKTQRGTCRHEPPLRGGSALPQNGLDAIRLG